MKITLNESKEKIPAEFITSFVSKGWEEVGALKAEIKAIKEDYTGTTKVVEALQDLLDAYLVSVGRLQAYLEDKDLVVVPTEVNESLNESLEEDTNVAVDHVDVNVDNLVVAPHDETDNISEDDELEAAVAAKMAMLDNKTTAKPTTQVNQTQADDTFEYFCDFEEPDLSEEPLTDEDLY